MVHMPKRHCRPRAAPRQPSCPTIGVARPAQRPLAVRAARFQTAGAPGAAGAKCSGREHAQVALAAAGKLGVARPLPTAHCFKRNAVPRRRAADGHRRQPPGAELHGNFSPDLNLVESISTGCSCERLRQLVPRTVAEDIPAPRSSIALPGAIRFLPDSGLCGLCCAQSRQDYRLDETAAADSLGAVASLFFRAGAVGPSRASRARPADFGM